MKVIYLHSSHASFCKVLHSVPSVPAVKTSRLRVRSPGQPLHGAAQALHGFHSDVMQFVGTEKRKSQCKSHCFKGHICRITSMIQIPVQFYILYLEISQTHTFTILFTRFLAIGRADCPSIGSFRLYNDVNGDCPIHNSIPVVANGTTFGSPLHKIAITLTHWRGARSSLFVRGTNCRIWITRSCVLRADLVANPCTRLITDATFIAAQPRRPR